MRHSTPILAFALLLAGVVILGGDVLFRGRVLSGPDLVNYFLPTALFARGWLQQGILPLWNPMTFCGWPLVGDAQTRWLYPPNLLLLALEPITGFSLLMIGYIAFGAIGMWFYLRRVAGVGSWPALSGAATLGLAGFFACHLMSGIVVFAATGAWVPWILLLGWRVGQTGAGSKTIALFAAAIGAQLFSGAPQIVFYTWITLLLQALWCIHESIARIGGPVSKLTTSFRHTLGILARYAAGGALGIAIGASSLIPVSEFGALSLQRGGKSRFEYVADCSLAPRYLWLTVAPKFFGDPRNEGLYWGGIEGHWEICGYVGAGPLVALLVVLLSWRSLLGKREPNSSSQTTGTQTISPSAFAAFHLFLGGLALFFAFGRYNPAFRWFYEWIPGFDRFRVPTRWLFFWQFSLATLLALVLEKSLGETGESPVLRKRAIVAVGCFIVFLIVAAVLSSQLMEGAGIRRYFRDFDPSSGRLLDLRLRNWTAGSLCRTAGFSLGWLILLGVAGKKIRPTVRQILPAFAAFLVLADVVTFGTSMPATRTRQDQANWFYPKSPLVEFLAAELAGHRLLAVDDVLAWYHDRDSPELWANRATIHGLRDARGYYPICSRWFGHFVNALSRRPPQTLMGSLLFVDPTLDPSLLSMLDVKFLLSYENLGIQGLRLVQRTSFGMNIFEVVGRWGPAFAVQSRPTVGFSDDEEIALLTGPGFDSRKFALASEPPPAWNVVPEEGSLRKAELVRQTPNRIVVSVENGAGDLIVISESYHPGWKANADSRPLRVVRANHALIGVYVPPGKHQVTLAFQPESFRIGLYLTFSALLVLATLATAMFGRGQGTAHP